MRSVVGSLGGLISHHFHVTGKETHLCPHLNLVVSIGLNSSKVEVFERSIHSDDIAIDGYNVSAFGFKVIEAG